MPKNAAPLVAASIVLYFVSLVLPALVAPSETYHGWLALALGWMTVASEIRWLANPLFVVALIAFGLTSKRPNLWACVPAVIAAGLAWSCLVIPPAVAVGGSSNPRMSTASLAIGAWCWMIALGLLAWATFIAPVAASAVTPPTKEAAPLPADAEPS